MQQNIPLFAIDTARKCAWRAFYVGVRATDRSGWEYRKQIAHLGIDPTASRANIFGAIGRFSFCIRLPFMQWRPHQWALRSWWQRWVCSLDGRYA